MGKVKEFASEKKLVMVYQRINGVTIKKIDTTFMQLQRRNKK